MPPAPLVMDASIAVSIARGEETGDLAHGFVRARVGNGGRVVVPSHFWLEVSNALMGRHRWTSAAVFEAVHVLDRLDPQTVDLDRPTLLSVLDLVERHGLTSYDATYLALADAIDGELLTLDRALRAAAGPRAVSIDGRRRLSETPAPYQHDVTWPDYKGASAYLAQLRVEARGAAAS
jgi:predicted nucleic acid-binding protein